MSEFVEHAKNFLIHTLTAQAKRKGVGGGGCKEMKKYWVTLPSFYPTLPSVTDGSCHKYHFFTAKVCLSQQNFCCNKHVFAMPNICRSKSFVTTNLILSQFFVVVVLTSILLSQQKMCFVVTNMFVATRTCLSRQKFCCDKNDICGNSCQ